MRKGIDQKFVHYGIRREDLALIEAICEKHEIDFEWLSEEVLRSYHSKKVDVIEMSDAETESIISAARRMDKNLLRIICLLKSIIF